MNQRIARALHKRGVYAIVLHRLHDALRRGREVNHAAS